MSSMKFVKQLHTVEENDDTSFEFDFAMCHGCYYWC